MARLFRTISSWSGVAVAAVGTLALVAWLFDLTALESVLPSLRTMRVNSAVCFLLLGSSIWFFNRADALPHRLRAARTLAVAAILIGLCTLVEYPFGIRAGIDDLLVGIGSASK
ncbi:MAG TPA: hypothetical protein VIK30_14005, partial [Polyangia bacterium]